LSVDFVAMASSIKGYKVFYDEGTKVWELIQFVYAKHGEDSEKRIVARRCLYRNMIISILAQIEVGKERRTPMLASLLDYISEHGRADGLESILLTLLYSMVVSDEKDVFERGVDVWKSYAANATVPGAGPMVFYNVSNGRLSSFSKKAVKSLRHGEFLKYDTDMANTLEDNSEYAFYNAFGSRNGDRAASRVVQRDERFNNQWNAWEKGLLFAGAGVGLVIAAVSLPVTAPAALVVGVLVGGGIIFWAAESEFFDAMQQLNQKEVPKPTSEIDTEPPDGTVAINEEGDPGEVGPDVDNEPVADGGDGEGDGGGDEGGCFTSDTVALMSDRSFKPISEITEGELVLGHYQEASIPCKVTQIHKHRVSATLDLLLSNGSQLTTTPRQKFSVLPQADFVPAQDLQLGKSLSDVDEKEISLVSAHAHKGMFDVFNLSIENSHTCYIGTNCVLVHNRKDEEPGPEEISAWA
jgi:hypothetical protein